MARNIIMTVSIAGSVKDDLKFFYPDKTGFQFDTRPSNVTGGRGCEAWGSDTAYYRGIYMSIPWNKSGGRYADETEHCVDDGYKGWTNWLNKMEIDARYMAISDINAGLSQFPEVQYPWKFTEYVFKGIDNSELVVEPSLYDPLTLKVINGVENPKDFKKGEKEYLRRVGKLEHSGYKNEKFENGFYYCCKYKKGTTDEQIASGEWFVGEERKQFETDEKLREKNGDLETGLIVDGKKYPPWTEPNARYEYRNTFINTRKICGARKVYNYMTPNRSSKSGVRLYRKDISAKCVDRGQHGNIPSSVINMTAPSGYITPEGMTKNSVRVEVTTSVGEAMYADMDGIVYIWQSSNGMNYTAIPEVFISPCSFTGNKVNHNGDRNMPYTLFSVTGGEEGGKVMQPKPSIASGFSEKCVARVGDVQSGDYVHRGCVYFVGTKESGCRCEIKRKLYEGDGVDQCTPITKPEEFIGMFGDDISGSNSSSDTIFSSGVGPEDWSKCTSYAANEGEVPSGKACKYYVQQQPKTLTEFVVEEMSSDDYNKISGYNTAVDINASAYSSLGALTGGMDGGLCMMYGAAMSQKRLEGSSGTKVGAMNVIKKYNYIYEKVEAQGREVDGQVTSVADRRNVVVGTGKFAFDKKSTSAIGGIDSDLFYGTNLINRHRFTSSVMHCYNEKVCKPAFGALNMCSGYAHGIYSGVGSEGVYCRYYNAGCPTTEIPQRALEYDRSYVSLIEYILNIYRTGGVGKFPGLEDVSVGGGVHYACGTYQFPSYIASVIKNDNTNIYFAYKEGEKSNSGSGSLSNAYDNDYRTNRVFAFIKQYGKPSVGPESNGYINNSGMSDTSYLKMNKSKYSKIDFPNFFKEEECPWLVELFDDYVSPTKYEPVVTNLMPFIGGRMPEYRDYSKMGGEIQCEVSVQEAGFDGQLTSGKGGSDDRNDYTTSKSYQYYRVDASGEWIIEDVSDDDDGLSIGRALETFDATANGGEGEYSTDNNGARLALAPSCVNGAFPIAGAYRNQSYSAEGNRPAMVTRAWVFSSDTRDFLQKCPSILDTNTEGESAPATIPLANVSMYCLPTERHWYYCPKCTPKPYSYFSDSSNSSSNVSPNTEDGKILNKYGEKQVKQIFTDFEYQQYIKCPRCKSIGVDTDLELGGSWKYFPQTRARGNVNYFGLPGEIIDGKGYFWKNHTEISRSFISEIRTKQGIVNNDGGGFQLSYGGSSNKETESSVQRYCQTSNPNFGTNVVAGYTNNQKYDAGRGLIGGNEQRYTATDVKLPEENWAPKFMGNNDQLLFGYSGNSSVKVSYNDRYINPYALSESQIRAIGEDEKGDFKSPLAGLDFAGANQFKFLRNMSEPCDGYPLYDIGDACGEYIGTKQYGYKYRFSYVNKNINDKLIGMTSIILAANEAGTDQNYIQFWDGTLSPGKCVQAHYPPSPLWWFRRDLMGGIIRNGGGDAKHFNDASGGVCVGMKSYAGNVQVGCFHMLHGWLPLDKEVVGAVYCITPTLFPDEGPIGRTTNGGPLHEEHWHSWLPDNWPDAINGSSRAAHDAADWEALKGVMGWSDTSAEGISGGGNLSNGNYTPLFFSQQQFTGGDDIITKYSDDTFGFGTVQNFLSWDGYGKDLKQVVKENEIWKKYTFSEYNTLVNQHIMDLTFEIGNSDDDIINMSISVMPDEISDGFINNAGQAITNMFNLTGLNSSGIFNKNGMENAEKKYDTEWSSGGQVLVQDESGVKLLSGANAKMGTEHQEDITSTIKKYYNDRVTRAFEGDFGIGYNDIWLYIKKNRVESGINNESDEAVEPGINSRSYEAWAGGYILNNFRIFPELDSNGDFLTTENGDEIKRNCFGVIDSVGGFAKEKSFSSNSSSAERIDSSSPKYWRYHPVNLCQTDENGAIITGSWSKNENGNLVFVKGGSSSDVMCRLNSYIRTELYFVMNLSRYPAQTFHRMYRSEKGSYNTSNCVCQNEKCYLNEHNLTVSEASAISYGGSSNRLRNYRFDPAVTKCGYCGSSLLKNPKIKYVGGDGIETWGYTSLPEKDSIVNGLQIEIANSANKRNGFSVYSKSSGDSYWTKLIGVKWLEDSNEFEWKEYGQNDELVIRRGVTLPKFKGKWCDGYVKSGMSGYHFVAVRANKIKFVAEPLTKDSSGEKLENDGRMEENSDIVAIGSSNNTGEARKFKLSISGLESVDRGGVLCIYSDYNLAVSDNNCVPYFSSTIRGYDSATNCIYINDEIPQEAFTDGFCYKIKSLKYTCDIKSFKVFGLEVGDYITMTGDADGVSYPIFKGTTSLNCLDRIIKFLQIRAIHNEEVVYEMEDYGNSVIKVEDLRYYAKKNSSTKKYEIYGGEIFYDTYQNIIYLPYKCSESKGSRAVIKEITSIWDENVVDQSTIPTIIDIKYMTNVGRSITVPISSIGEGPSYIVEPDTITYFYPVPTGGNPSQCGATDVGSIYSNCDNFSKYNIDKSLPEIGKSVFLMRKNSRINLEWKVTNRGRTNYTCGDLSESMTGFELAGKKVIKSDDFLELFGGPDETYNGIPTKKNSAGKYEKTKRLMTGKASGEVTISGLPNCILSGKFCVYAAATRILSNDYGEGINSVTTYERTGGLRKTGFLSKMANGAMRALCGGHGLVSVACSRPRIIVYLRERLLAEKLQ